MEYKFQDEKNTMAITTKRIVGGQRDILLVSHDEDNGMWEFLDGEDVDEENALIVSMSEIVQIDESINKLYDLPLGGIAYRKNKKTKWIRNMN